MSPMPGNSCREACVAPTLRGNGGMRMPIYMEISRLYRSVTIIARGAISREEIMAVAEQLVEAQVPGFTKLVDVATATADVTPGDIRRLAAVLRKVGNLM